MLQEELKKKKFVYVKHCCKWHQKYSGSFKNESSGRKLWDDQMAEMTAMANYELKHTNRPQWESHRWALMSLPAPQAHVRATRRKWGVSPAAFRERLRDACELCLAPGKEDTDGWDGQVEGRRMRERDTKPLKLLHGQRDTRQAAAGRTEGGGQEALHESDSPRTLRRERTSCLPLIQHLMNKMDWCVLLGLVLIVSLGSIVCFWWGTDPTTLRFISLIRQIEWTHE